MHVLIVSADRTDHGGGAANLGDAFLTDTLLEALRDSGHDAVAVDFGPERTVPDEPRTATSRLTGLFRAIRAADAVIVGGGTLFQDDDPGTGFGGLPRLCATVSWMARAARKPLVFLGVGCDPIARRAPRLILKAAVWRRRVWLRDVQSQERFVRYFGRPAQLGADLALLSKPSPSAPKKPGRVVLAPNLRDTDQVTHELVDALRARNHDVQFVAMDQRLEGGDQTGLESSLLSSLPRPASQIGWREAQAEVAVADVVMASRMHALYLAILTGTACVAVGNSAKVAAFADEFLVARVPAFHVDAIRDAIPASSESLTLATLRARKMLTEALDALTPAVSLKAGNL